jgi:hypothetical protein
MKNNNSLVLSTFLQQMDECIRDVIRVYPDICKTDARFLKCKLYLETLKQTNPRLMVITWKSKINDKYRAQILAKDVNFFIQKDYQEDAEDYYDNTVESAINDLRNIIRNMSETNIEIAMRYIQNLCKLADLYEAS